MKDLKGQPLHKIITIISIPFLYLFNIMIIVWGCMITYNSFMSGAYGFAILAVLGMVVLPIAIIVWNNPKKLWKSINDPLGDKKDKK